MLVRSAKQLEICMYFFADGNRIQTQLQFRTFGKVLRGIEIINLNENTYANTCNEFIWLQLKRFQTK